MRRRFIPQPSSLIPLLIVLLIVACAQQPTANHEVHRVVTLAPNLTEITFTIGCGGKVVGTDSFSNTPDPARGIPKVGGVEPDLEKIIALHPDLVIASSSNAHPNLREAFRNARIPLLVVRTDRLSDVATAMRIIGNAAGCEAGPAIRAFNRALEDQRRFRTKSPRILFAVWTDPLYVAGKQTFVDDLYTLTGAKNAADVTAWPQYSLEAMIQHPPDLLLYPNPAVTAGAVQTLLGRAHLPVDATAVDENLFSRPGPRLPRAAAELNRICDAWERSH